jgi:hypothetical protein
VQGLVSSTLEVQPQAVTAAFLATHMPELAASGAAQQLAALFKQAGLLDAQGMLARDPRGSDWRRVVTGSSIPGVPQGGERPACFFLYPTNRPKQLWTTGHAVLS